MTAAWLLPIVSTIVAAATGGIVAGVLEDPQHALWVSIPQSPRLRLAPRAGFRRPLTQIHRLTITFSYILWGTGVPLAMSTLVIYFQRLTIHNLPPREVIVSVFLPLGPLGQGAFGIMQLGKAARSTFPKTGTLQITSTAAGDTLYVVGWVLGLIMWGYAMVWLFFAVASITRSKFRFNMGWWG